MIAQTFDLKLGHSLPFFILADEMHAQPPPVVEEEQREVELSHPIGGEICLIFFLDFWQFGITFVGDFCAGHASDDDSIVSSCTQVLVGQVTFSIVQDRLPQVTLSHYLAPVTKKPQLGNSTLLVSEDGKAEINSCRSKEDFLLCNN